MFQLLQCQLQALNIFKTLQVKTLQTFAVNNIQLLLIKNEVDKDKRILGNYKSFSYYFFQKEESLQNTKKSQVFNKSPFGVLLVDDFSYCNKKISFLIIG